MIILIDGYNVLKQALSPHLVQGSERDIFIKLLQQYALLKGHKIVLVFDAGPFDFPSKEPFGKVLVVYAGAGNSADDYIKEYLVHNKGKDLFLVTSDRALRSCAQRLNIESIPAMDFYRMLVTGKRADHKKLQESDEVVKLTDKDDHELDSLMQTSDVHLKSDDLIIKKERKRSEENTSKKDRKLLQKIKKL